MVLPTFLHPFWGGFGVTIPPLELPQVREGEFGAEHQREAKPAGFGCFKRKTSPAAPRVLF